MRSIQRDGHLPGAPLARGPVWTGALPHFATRIHRIRQSRQIAIGEGRKPDPLGRPGYLRVDTVHQGQKERKVDVFHINAVTQWQTIGCLEMISERHMLPVLGAMLHQFPFRILGFQCDNGSGFLNYRVAEMFEKLLVEFTKCRACRPTDNAFGGRQERRCHSHSILRISTRT